VTTGTEDIITVGLPMFSFMLLRVAVALRSVQDASTGVMWKGVAFACFTRCLAEGPPLFGDSKGEVDAVALLMAGARELAHVYGLCLVLGRCRRCAEP